MAGTQLTLLESGVERLDTILRLIGQSKRSIRLLFYMFNSDEAGTRIRDALVEAAGRGVEVRVLLDGFGSGDIAPDFFSGLEQAGGDHCIFHPRYGRRYLMRNHQKLAVFDDQLALIGGANLHESYLSDEGETCWRDLWLLLEGEAVPPAAAYFDDLYHWTITKGSKVKQLRRLVCDHSQAEGALQWKFTSPLSRRNPWVYAIVSDVNEACRLDVIAAYFSPSGSMLRRMRRVMQRGQVRVITASKSDNRATIAAARSTYRRLLRRGVEMYEYLPARLHTKLIVVDDVVHLGSANFDFRSFYINLEIMLRIEDAGFAKQMRGYFEREKADSQQITPQLHRERSTLWRRIKWTVSHWLVTSMDYTVTRRLNFRVD
ncbi:phosphatidylserine/phosphatidylglycerophosphate/cardiolipin synthase family protein [Sphingomonas sinipercae]|uniref:Phospholipase D n=1 Tax=Sphingomonas sinipercae TaxID=2714944 RepID=A0A6G7ZQQ1_9SPHN|nr:phosphatidylserine/phosphatidylglycerophosphate/cardiolipin synthase family protein [Sphingomonas sinipercae]